MREYRKLQEKRKNIKKTKAIITKYNDKDRNNKIKIIILVDKENE